MSVTDRRNERNAPPPGAPALAPSRVFRPPLRGEEVISTAGVGVGLQAQPPETVSVEAARERRIARLEAERDSLRLENARLRRLVGVDTSALEPLGTQPEWAKALTPQEWSLVIALNAAWPKAVRNGSLADSLPRRDHASDPADKGLDTIVCKVRQKLGRDAIETAAGCKRLGERIAVLMAERLEPDQGRAA